MRDAATLAALVASRSFTRSFSLEGSQLLHLSAQLILAHLWRRFCMSSGGRPSYRGGSFRRSYSERRPVPEPARDFVIVPALFFDPFGRPGLRLGPVAPSDSALDEAPVFEADLFGRPGLDRLIVAVLVLVGTRLAIKVHS